MPPRLIMQHPGVADCSTPDGGFIEVSEGGTRYDVLLRDGWRFANLGDGDRQSARFRTVAEFRAAKPRLIRNA